MTGLAGGFAADGAISWVADSLSRHGAAAAIACATLGWEGSSVPAQAAIAVFTSARKAPTLRALVQARRSSVSRSFAPGAATHGCTPSTAVRAHDMYLSLPSRS